MNIIISSSRESEYKDFIMKHKENVIKSYELFIKNTLLNEIKDPSLINEITDGIYSHDESKLSDEEFYPYLNEYYPDDNMNISKEEIEDQFDLAWLHHQHVNGHHYQHWILNKDSGEEIIIDMPLKYVVEMLCDWHSFSEKDPKSTALIFYNENRKNMKLSDNTVKTIEKYINLFDEPLSKYIEN